MTRSATPQARAGRRYVVDPARCRTCGRAGEGLRCGRPITLEYQRGMVARRATQHWPGGVAAGNHPEAAPCSRACPLALCIQGYAVNIAAGNLEEALAHVLVRTTLPETVCRVCDRPCERQCIRRDVDGPVAINDLKRYVVGWAAEHGRLDGETRAPETRTGKRVAVVGAGPAGLTVADRLATSGHDVTLYDAADRAGGIPAQHIPRYRLPPEAVRRDVARVLAAGVRFVGGTALGSDVRLGALLAEHDSVYLALGAGRPRALELAGADHPDAPEVIQGLDLLRAARRDDAFDVDGDVVVVGGGDAAIDAARSALRLGARRVTVACIEPHGAMPALPDQVVAAVAEGVALAPALAPLRLEPRAMVFEPIDDPDATERWIAADRVVLAIGQEPDWGFLGEGDPQPERTPDGRIAAHPLTGETSIPRLFAGGDLVAGGGTVARAIASGLRTAAAIHRALTDDEGAPVPPPTPVRADARSRDGEMRVTTRSSRRRMPPVLRTEQRIGGFAEVVGALSERDARAEGMRCLACGSCGNCRACIDLFACPALIFAGDRVEIEPSLCNGCGVCADLCPNGAIVPEEVRS